MASIGVGPEVVPGNMRIYEKCRVVAATFTNMTDADTFAAGPGLMGFAWEQPTTNIGVGNWIISDQDTGTLTWDSGSAAQEGTLYLFYGTHPGGV